MRADELAVEDDCDGLKTSMGHDAKSTAFAACPLLLTSEVRGDAECGTHCYRRLPMPPLWTASYRYVTSPAFRAAAGVTVWKSVATASGTKADRAAPEHEWRGGRFRLSPSAGFPSSARNLPLARKLHQRDDTLVATPPRHLGRRGNAPRPASGVIAPLRGKEPF